MTVADDLATLSFILDDYRSDRGQVALARVRAEIARLESLANIQHWRRAESAEAEAERLRDGLRQIATDSDQWCEAQCGKTARALLAEDGAA